MYQWYMHMHMLQCVLHVLYMQEHMCKCLLYLFECSPYAAQILVSGSRAEQQGPCCSTYELPRWVNHTLSFIVQRYHELWSSLSTVRLQLCCCVNNAHYYNVIIQSAKMIPKRNLRLPPSCKVIWRVWIKVSVCMCSHMWTPAVWTRALKYQNLSVSRLYIYASRREYVKAVRNHKLNRSKQRWCYERFQTNCNSFHASKTIAMCVATLLRALH